MRLKQGKWQNDRLNHMYAESTGNLFELYNMAALDHFELRPILTYEIGIADFGPVKEELKRSLGSSAKYNLRFYNTFNRKLTIDAHLHQDNGTKITCWGMLGLPETWTWMTDEDLKLVLSKRESLYWPSLPSYISPKPENQGKIYWLSGPNGTGKSTTCQLMAKKGFVYFEGDCMVHYLNPFLDHEVENPFNAAFQQPVLKVKLRSLKYRVSNKLLYFRTWKLKMLKHFNPLLR